MLPLFFNILILICPFPEGKQKTKYLEWSPYRKLNWTDFRADTPRSSIAAAQASTFIRIDWGYYSDSLRYHIHCRFDQDSSWVRIRNDYVLTHEQGHFDLTEVYARKLNQALKNYHADEKNYRSGVNAIYQELMKKFSEAQDQFDRETNFSRNHQMEEEWLDRIRRELEELKEQGDYR